MKFPDPEQAGHDGLLCMGGELNTETLASAYTQGIFPWPRPGCPILWFSPPERGVLFFKNFKIPKTTQKALRGQSFKVTQNQVFEEVIKSCARIPRESETGTWIVPEMIAAYIELHKKGNAVSYEAWQGDELVGGLYGVLFNGVFSGESMFFKVSEASKVCLVQLVDDLKNQGHTWMDIQMVTPLLKQFGGVYMTRKKFLNLLKERHDH